MKSRIENKSRVEALLLKPATNPNIVESLVHIYEYLCNDKGNPNEKICKVLHSFIMGYVSLTWNSCIFDQQCAMKAVQSLAYAFPDIHSSIPTIVLSELKCRNSTEGRADFPAALESDSGLITGLIIIAGLGHNDGLRNIEESRKFDANLLTLMAESLKQRHFQYSYPSNGISSGLSSAVKVYVEGAISMARKGFQGRWEGINHLMEIAYDLSFFDQDDELKDKRMHDDSLEAKLCNELFFKAVDELPRRSRYAMFVGSPRIYSRSTTTLAPAAK